MKKDHTTGAIQLYCSKFGNSENINFFSLINSSGIVDIKDNKENRDSSIMKIKGDINSINSSDIKNKTDKNRLHLKRKPIDIMTFQRLRTLP